MTRKVRVAIATTLGVAIATLVALVLVEGTSSFVIFAHRIFANPPGEDRGHVRFDPLLGWVNNPNVFIPDMWGPGVYLRTNAQGFRNDRDTPKNVPEDKLRVVCSGDSFTQGYGVANDHALCQQLSSLDPRLEPVNMGQAGYGIDQAFLWYQRDGRVLDHDIHVFAFITDDFLRMQGSNYNGYAKPVLRVRNGALVAENVPLQEASFLAPWLVQLHMAAAELRTLVLIEKIQGRMSSAEAPVAPKVEQRTLDVALKAFDTLQDANHAKNSRLVLVYLPRKPDYDSQDKTTDLLRHRLRAEAERRGFFFVDLVEEFRRLPSGVIDGMFIPGHEHYTVSGNEWAARVLYRRLLSDTTVQQRLADIPRS